MSSGAKNPPPPPPSGPVGNSNVGTPSAILTDALHNYLGPPNKELLVLKEQVARRIYGKDKLQKNLNYINGDHLHCGCPMCTDFMACNYEADDDDKDRYYNREVRVPGSEVVLDQPATIRECRLVQYFRAKCRQHGVHDVDMGAVLGAPRTFNLTTRLSDFMGEGNWWPRFKKLPFTMTERKKPSLKIVGTAPSSAAGGSSTSSVPQPQNEDAVREEECASQIDVYRMFAAIEWDVDEGGDWEEGQGAAGGHDFASEWHEKGHEEIFHDWFCVGKCSLLPAEVPL